VEKGIESRMMDIQKVILHIIQMPLKNAFSTHLGTVDIRDGIIVEVIDGNGMSGYGEVVAFTTPWYTEETVKTCLHMLEEILIPLVFSKEIKHPKEIITLFNGVRRNQMAKASLEMAIWDLFAKQQNKPLWQIIGGSRQEVLSGAVVSASSMEMMSRQTEELVQEGYTRIKVKISPKHDYGILQSLRKKFPHLMIMADANSAYSLQDKEELKKLDELKLEMIEQPLAVDDIVEHAILQKEFQTPICLDESITSPMDMKNAIRLQSCKMVNIKLARVGGYSNALDIYKLCQQNNIGVWCGGMIEFGVSRAHNIALATLSGFSFPGDIVASRRYWEEDIIEPGITVENGKIKRINRPGIGVNINWKRMREVTKSRKEYNA
jgi:o-succinylbenzoate synthase